MLYNLTASGNTHSTYCATINYINVGEDSTDTSIKRMLLKQAEEARPEWNKVHPSVGGIVCILLKLHCHCGHSCSLRNNSKKSW